MATPPLPVEFLAHVARLKHLPRTGWVRAGVPTVEPVAGHMYRLALLAMLVPAEAGLDREKAMRMALMHDIAESIVGDITPFDGVSKEEKHRRERAAMDTLSGELGAAYGGVANEMTALWNEYEEGKSKEAALVKALDKFEMLVSAAEYEREHHMDLSGFFASVPAPHHPVLRHWHAQLLASRRPHTHPHTADASTPSPSVH